MKQVKMISRKLLESWDHCSKYTAKLIDKLAAGRKSISVLTIFKLPIQAEDKVWLLCHEGILPEETFRRLAREFALRVIDLWDAPPVVREYLETGDETIRAASSAASSAASRAASSAAAWAASWDASSAASWAASRAASWDASRAASWDASSAASWDASRAASSAAAWAASSAASSAASRAASWEWQLEKIRKELTKLTPKETPKRIRNAVFG